MVVAFLSELSRIYLNGAKAALKLVDLMGRVKVALMGLICRTADLTELTSMEQRRR